MPSSRKTSRYASFIPLAPKSYTHHHEYKGATVSPAPSSEAGPVPDNATRRYLKDLEIGIAAPLPVATITGPAGWSMEPDHVRETTVEGKEVLGVEGEVTSEEERSAPVVDFGLARTIADARRLHG